MTREQARIGARVRSLVDFSGVPKGHTGIIDEDYQTGVMVRWDPITETDRRHPIRDGFDKERELRYLEVT